MAISDKTRKILWGRSGDRCVLCYQKLVVAATSADREAVVGDECHIISGKPQGPRYDPTFPAEGLDDAANFILLCRVCHKIVDDQPQTYTVEFLRSLKTKHEASIAAKLKTDRQAPQLRISRLKENIPTYLVRLTSGLEVLKIMEGAYSGSFDHDEPQSETEADLLASFLQEAQEWADLSNVLGAGERVRAAFRISALLDDLERAGFWVFGGREIQRLEGGVGPPSAWPLAILQVCRTNNPEIINGDSGTAETP